MNGRPEIRFVVWGLPQSKGSARAFIPKGWSRPVITSTNKGLKTWERSIKDAVQPVLAETPSDVKAAIFDAPVALSLLFHLPRPKSLPKRVTQHTKKPDLSKLVRGAEDALIGLVYRDDAQIVAIGCKKLYADGAAKLEVIVEGWGERVRKDGAA